MKSFPVDAVWILAVKIVGGNIHFAADNGLDPSFLGLDEKFHGAIEHAVVGDGDGVHAKFLGAVKQIVDLGETVKQAIVGVDMEMRKFHINFMNFIFERISFSDYSNFL